jgi:hypothetical protein
MTETRILDALERRGFRSDAAVRENLPAVTGDSGERAPC